MLRVRTQLLQILVCSLNWETLGHASVPPRHARAGMPVTSQQQRVLDLLEAQIDHFLRVPPFLADDLGRSASKFFSFAKLVEELPNDKRVGQDLLDWADMLHGLFRPYEKRGRSERAAPGTLHHDSPPRAGNPPSFLDFREQGSLPVKADRIKWRYSPSFDPSPFLDPLLSAAFRDPQVLRKPVEDWPECKPAKVHCSREELLRLAAKWDSCSALAITPASEVDWNEAVGLFAVAKSAANDRLIVNPVVANSRSYTLTNFAKTLTPGSMLALLHLRPHEVFRYQADDLSDYYYTYQISSLRAKKNSVRCLFDPSELEHLAASKRVHMCGKQMISLNTMAMGDSLSVEVGQAAHYGVLRELAGALAPSQTLLYRHLVPRSATIEMLAIDDHIALQKVDRADLAREPELRDSRIFARATEAYEQVGLVLNADKKRRNLVRGVLLGADFDGIRGVVCPPRDRLASLMCLTARVGRKGFCTLLLLERILGCWVHALMFRRPVFAVVDELFREGQGLPRNQVFRLSPKSRNELLILAALAPSLQSDLRVQYDNKLYCMDASPFGGAVCEATIGSAAAQELWRHCEQRGYHTRLQSQVAEILRDKGLVPNSEDSLAPPVDPCRAVFPRIQCDWRLPSSLSEGVLYDCVEIFRGTGNWSHAHCRHGLRVHDGFDVDGRRARIADLSDPAVARELVALALRGVVREWHAGVPCVSFGTLRRPRVRSRLIPYGFNPKDSFTQLDNMLARRTAFVLCIAVRRGQYVSVEQPAGSCLYHLACYKVLVGLGCIVTTFCYCSFGSPFLKRSRWLHNKPWLCSLEGGCRCRYKKQHFVVQGSFDADSLSEFQRRCIPSVRQVYGVEPLVGQSVASYSGAYPLGLVDRMASGSVHALEGFRGVIAPEHHARTEKFLGVAPSSSWPLWFADEEPFEPRPDHEDPEWVKELCQSLSFREVFRYRFKRPGHINVNESRVFKSWIKSLARKTSSTRCVGLLDSRVAIGAAAKGRSSSFAISRVLQGCLGYVLGSGLYPGLLHCYSEDNVADAPSRGHSVKPPRRQVPQWLAELMSGKAQRFDKVVASACIKRVPGRWLRLLLLLAGDIETNPGPVVSREPRGPLDLSLGFAPSTAIRMQKCLQAFEHWLRTDLRLEPAKVYLEATSTAAALRGYGLHLYASGLPRYLLVYAITAVQDAYPRHRNFLSEAWQVDRKWQIVEPGACRPVLPVAAVRAAISVALLWSWHRWAALVTIGFLAMLHPGELLALCRKDLVFPEDTLGHTTALFVHLANPKTARFARRQHGKIDDPIAVAFLFRLFGNEAPSAKLYPASMYSFRRQWQAVLDRLGLPCKAAAHGATPGVLRGSGATFFYQVTENIPLLAWRGRWSRVKTLEYYLQEVAAQVLLSEVSNTCRARIRVLDKACDALVTWSCNAPQK